MLKIVKHTLKTLRCEHGKILKADDFHADESFLSFLIHLLLVSSRIPQIPKEKNSTDFPSTVEPNKCFITAPLAIF